VARGATGKHRAPRGPVALVTFVVLVLVLLAWWAVGRSDVETRATGVADRPVSVTTSVPETAACRARSVVVPEAPVAARLPSGRVVPVRAASTTADGALDLPEDIGTAG
jgi:hypothetical protein